MATTQSKIVSRAVLKKKIVSLRRRGRTIAFTNGCFDIMHLGHVKYLEAAKKGNRVLVVGLNSDRSVRTIKGAGRPIVNQGGRAGVLAALACVDFVTIFNESTPLKLIETVKPDILIKGADWKRKGAVGSESVKAHGGRIEFIKLVPGFSSTDIIKRVSKYAKKKR